MGFSRASLCGWPVAAFFHSLQLDLQQWKVVALTQILLLRLLALVLILAKNGSSFVVKTLGEISI